MSMRRNEYGCGYERAVGVGVCGHSHEPCAWTGVWQLSPWPTVYGLPLLFPRRVPSGPLALWPSDAISPSFEHHHHAAQGVTPTARPPNGLCLTSPAMYASGSRREAQPPAPLCGRVANCKLKQLTPRIAVSNEQSPILSTSSSLRAQIACCKLDTLSTSYGS